jgi:hypothetical protein
MTRVRPLLVCALIGVVAAALVPYVHPWVHEGEAFAASLAGLLLALTSTRLVLTKQEREAAATRERRARRIAELVRR